MAWAGGVWHSSAGTDTTALSAGMNTYHSRKFLKRAVNTLRFAPLGQKRDLPKGEGKSIDFFRYNEIATSVSGAFLTDGTNPNPTQITGQVIAATVSEWGAFSQHSRLSSDAHIDRKLVGVRDLWATHAGNHVDLIAQMAFANGSYPFRCDGNNSNGIYYFTGTFDAVGTATTATDATGLKINSNFGDGNDDGNQSVLVVTAGTGYGQARVVTDYVTATGVMTVSPAWDVIPASGDSFVLVSAHALDSTDKLTTANVRNAVAILRNNNATPFEGQWYVGVLSPDTEAGLMGDTNWLNVMQYRDNPEIKVSGLFKGEVGEWGGVRWVRANQPFRFPIEAVGTAGTAGGPGAFVPGTGYTNYASGGAVYMTPIVGMEAFGTTTFKGGDIMKPGIIVKRPGPQDTSNPLNMFNTVGWYLPYIAKSLNPMFGIQMWSGA